MEAKDNFSGNTPFVPVDCRPLIEAIREAVREEVQTLVTQQSADPYPGVPPLGYGIKESARLLHVSTSTLARAKERGEIDDCIYQSGKIVIFNIHRILDKWRLDKQKDKFKHHINSKRL